MLHESTMRHLLVAGLITIALYFVPYLQFVTYPLRLLVTFIHEGSHATAALITGGTPVQMLIQPDASGLTYTTGGFGPIISSAGYLGATLYGAVLIAAIRRGVPGRTLLLITGALIGIETLCLVRNPFGFAWGALLCAGLLIAGRKLSPMAAAWSVMFIGIQCILNALFDLKTLFDLSVMSATPTDAQNMAQMTLIPAVVWSVLWICTAFGMLWTVLAPAFGFRRRARQR